MAHLQAAARVGGRRLTADERARTDPVFRQEFGVDPERSAYDKWRDVRDLVDRDVVDALGFEHGRDVEADFAVLDWLIEHDPDWLAGDR